MYVTTADAIFATSLTLCSMPNSSGGVERYEASVGMNTTGSSPANQRSERSEQDNKIRDLDVLVADPLYTAKHEA